jgi:hypothetical protein
MEPIFFKDLDEEAKKQALVSYKETVYPELFEDYSSEGLVEQIGPFTDDESLVREMNTLGIIFTRYGSLVTDGDLLYIAYHDGELAFVHVSADDIRNFKPHYLRYVARKMDRAIR